MRLFTRPGFTIIESVLFMSISALVFIVGFMGIGSRLEAVRYTDSVRKLESDVETVFRNADDGVNLRPLTNDCDVSGDSAVVSTVATDKTRGQQNKCAVAGVDVIFSTDPAKKTKFDSHSVAVATGQYSGSDFHFFTTQQISGPTFDIHPYMINGSDIPSTSGSYDLQWALEYSGYIDSSSNLSASPVKVRYVRSPISAQTYIYTDANAAGFQQLTAPLHVCFVNPEGRTATLTFDPNATTSVAYGNGACSP